MGSFFGESRAALDAAVHGREEELPALPEELSFSGGSLLPDSAFASGFSLLRCLCRVWRGQLSRIFALGLLRTAAALCVAPLVGAFVSHVRGEAAGNAARLCSLAFGLGVTLVLGVVFGQMQQQGTLEVSMRLRRSLNALVLHEVLARQALAASGPDPLNFVHTDAEDIAWLPQFAIEGLLAAALFVGAMAMLVATLGPAGLVGLLLVPVSFFMSQASRRLFAGKERRVRQERDARSRHLRHFMARTAAMKAIGAETFLEDKMQSCRHLEVTILKRMIASRALLLSLAAVLSFLVFLGTLAVASCSGALPGVGSLFSSLALFGLLQTASNTVIMNSIVYVGAAVCLQRLRHLLGARERPGLPECAAEPVAIAFQQASLVTEDGCELLSKVDFCLRRGECVAVTGPVGSGKSLLLQLAAGLLACSSGKVLRAGSLRVGYLAQTPGLLEGTLRENILLGREAPEDEVARVLDATGLALDLHQSGRTLDSPVSTGGANLSGGQRQRLAWARALLNRPELLIVDDGFSALDSVLGEKLLDALLFSRETTCLVVVQNPSLLGRFSRILHLKEGKVVKDGSGADLVSGGLQTPTGEASPSSQGEPLPVELGESPRKGRPLRTYVSALGGFERRRSSVKLSFLVAFAMACSFALLPQHLWLAAWQGRSRLPWGLAPGSSLLGNFAVFGALGITAALFVCANEVVWKFSGVKASTAVFDKSLHRLLHAAPAFLGRLTSSSVLNSFSRDVSSIENTLVRTLEESVRATCRLLSPLLLSVVAFPPLALLVAPAFFAVRRGFKRFLAASTFLRRRHASLRTRRFAALADALTAAQEFRAMGCEGFLAERFAERLDGYHVNLRATYLVNRWISTRVPMLVSLVVALLILAVGLASGHGLIEGAVAVVICSQLVGMGELSDALCRSLSAFQTDLVAVERMERYLEAPLEDDAPALSLASPARGALEIEGLRVRYVGSGQDVLAGVDLAVEAGESVAVCGRSGSGKSTLFSAILGLVPETGGEVRLGGVCLRSSSKKAWREKFAVLPQSPCLFFASLRENLTLGTMRSDAELRDALSRVGFSETAFPQGLDTILNPDASGLSEGELALVVLARLTLSRAPVVLIDEGGAKMDLQSEAKIQEALDAACGNKTRLVIAHRHETLARSQRLFRMEQGLLHPVRSQEESFHGVF